MNDGGRPRIGSHSADIMILFSLKYRPIIADHLATITRRFTDDRTSEYRPICHRNFNLGAVTKSLRPIKISEKIGADDARFSQVLLTNRRDRVGFGNVSVAIVTLMPFKASMHSYL